MENKLVNKRMIDADALITYFQDETDFGYSNDIGGIINVIETFVENECRDEKLSK